MKRKRKQSIKLYWLISYLLVLLIAVVIMSLVYSSTNSSVLQMILNANEESLISTRSRVDDKLSQLEQNIIKIEENFRITKNRFISGDFHSLDGYDNYESHRSLGNYMIGNRYIRTCFVYYQNSHTIISDSVVADADLYYDLYIPSGISKEDWFELITTYHRGGYRHLISEDGVEAVYYMRTSPLFARQQTRNTMNTVLSINTNELMAEANTGEGYFCVVDGQGNLIYGNSAIDSVSLALGDVTSRRVSVQETFTESGDEWILSYIKSARNDWRYVIATPKAMFYEKINHVRTVTTVGISLCIILSAAMIAFSIQFNYNPVKRLLAELDLHSGTSYNKERNEYSLLSQYLHQADSDSSKRFAGSYFDYELMHAAFARALKASATVSVIPPPHPSTHMRIAKLHSALTGRLRHLRIIWLQPFSLLKSRSFPGQNAQMRTIWTRR